MATHSLKGRPRPLGATGGQLHSLVLNGTEERHRPPAVGGRQLQATDLLRTAHLTRGDALLATGSRSGHPSGTTEDDGGDSWSGRCRASSINKLGWFTLI
jgi:hypothetical protein